MIGLCLWQPAQAQERLRSPSGRPSELTPGQTKALSKRIKQAQASGQQLRKAASGTTFIGIKPWRAQTENYWSSDNNIYDQIIYLNRDFRKANVQFYVISSGIGTITATTSQTLAYPGDEANLLNQNFDATAINVYFAKDVYDCRGTDCVLLPGLTPGLFDIVNLGDRSTYKASPNVQAKKDDYIMIGFRSTYQDVNYNLGPARSALSHEMGHYFGLLDTQQGGDAANCADRERPIGNRTAGDTDRGDLIDDTDADPLLVYLNSGLGGYQNLPYNREQNYCTYSGTAEHCDLTLPVRTFTPPTTNVMSYWGNVPIPIGLGSHCDDSQNFTPHQVDRMQSYLPTRLNAGNQYQLENGTPGVTVLPAISLSTSQNKSYITITQLPGAVDYILERATDANFTDVASTPSTSFPFYSSSSNVPNSFRDYAPQPAGKTWYYCIRAINGIVYSNVVSCAPTATLTGSQTVSNGQSATYTVALTGTPPWDVQVGGQTYTNLTASPLRIVTAPFQALQQTYTQTTSGGSVTNTCGTAPMSGTASVTVLGTCPVISASVTYSDIGCGRSTGQGAVQITGGATPYAIKWRNVTTGVDYTQAYTTAFGLTLGNYTVDVTDANGCRAPQQTFSIRDNGPNGTTATLSGPTNNRIPRGQQTSIRVELTGAAPWSVTYTGLNNQQYIAGNITTASYDITVLPQETTTYRLVAVTGQCSATAVSGSATLIVVPALLSFEYFVDSDPGIGLATSVAIGFNQTTANQALPVPIGLSGALATPGVHLIGVRAEDANGYWSLASLKPFIIFGQTPTNTSPITDVVYQLDGGPVTGRQVSLTSNQPVTLPVSISLTPGVHLLTARVYSNRGVFSGAVSRPFVVFGTGSTSSAAITQAEYYVDTDPGVGQAASLAFTPTPGALYALSINVGSITPGTHTLVIRTKDGSNRWSISYVRAFMVNLDARGISRVEYFLDSTDAGYGSGKPLAFSPPNSVSVTAQDQAGTTGLSLGAHTITVRAQAGGQVWSTTKAASFTVTTCATAAAFLYGSSTITAGQSAVVSVGLGGTPPYSLTANGQVQTSITTAAATFK